MAARVLVADNEPQMMAQLRTLLSGAGHEVLEASSGPEVLRRLFEANLDLVILDVEIPQLDGWHTFERIRDVSELPVLMLTSRAVEPNEVRGLIGGADDYLTKPFGPDELLCRADALLKRRPAVQPLHEAFDDDGIHIDFTYQSVTVKGREAPLTPVEYRLLAALARHEGSVLSPEQLLDSAWSDPSGVDHGRIKLAVLRLRRKLGWTDPAMSHIESVRGVGYRYRHGPQPAAAVPTSPSGRQAKA